MKRLKSVFLLVIALFSVFPFTKAPVFADNKESEIVIEINSKRVLFEKDADEKMYPASTTKILTAICVIENSDINKKVIITKECVGVEGSSIYLEEGEELTVKELLYGLMLRSGNDAATALALHVGGSIDGFAKMMNKFATKIGADSSNFVNPHGLHDDNHYVTARDLALISAYALKNDTFKEIVSTKKIEIPHTKRDYNRVLVNKNKMLFEYDGATGVKTGYTKKAGRCLVSSCERNGSEYVCVVLNCPPMFEKSKELLDNSFNNYVTHNLLRCENIIDFIDTETGGQVGVYIKNDILLPLTKEEENHLKIVYELPEKIAKNTLKDTEIGFVKIYAGNKLLFSEKVFTINDVD